MVTRKSKWTRGKDGHLYSATVRQKPDGLWTVDRVWNAGMFETTLLTGDYPTNESAQAFADEWLAGKRA